MVSFGTIQVRPFDFVLLQEKQKRNSFPKNAQARNTSFPIACFGNVAIAPAPMPNMILRQPVDVIIMDPMAAMAGQQYSGF